MAQKRSEADVISLQLPSLPEYLGVARLTVSGVANRLGFTYDEIEDIKLAVGEACSNAVKHAYCSVEESGVISLTFSIYPDRLVIAVADEGKGLDREPNADQLAPLYAGRDLDEVEEGGLGLYLIHALMDEVDIRTGDGVSVSMTKYVQRDGVAGDDRTISEEEV
ncbi:anti-sigma B factor RsbW [Brevibacillus nitrificans]|uniref:anti-sigma B factor RsbW n=1 Tax=Brevibacillus nitrificans TaxID=651560 RepID=UPI0028662808|nr:anti-sigma B factor RsbW [Brevibacillus nitrificans]MDR7319207.1 serine/threonine-protein kinase RsbW [Brevibacillus nitrificans]